MASYSRGLHLDLATALRRRRLELREAMSELEFALAAPANGRPGRWAEEVRVAALGLVSGLRDHIAVTEGPGGLHRELVETAPRLAGPVAALTAEHADLKEMLARLIEGIDGADLDVAATRDAGTELLDLLMRHRQRGADLVYEAYEFDVGGSG